jgi:hypothetical protein
MEWRILLWLRLLIVAASIANVSFSWADDPVDLRDKKGVIDPQDLRRHDPKPAPAAIKEPPPPPSPPKQLDVPPFEVKSHEGSPGNK